MPVISVVMPVYQGEETLDRAIHSIRGQTFLDWELLIVEDCSKDASRVIANQHAQDDRRVRVFSTDENSGIGTARNMAIRHATGEFVCYLDQDDEFYPDYLEHIARHANKADVLVFRYEILERDARGRLREWTWDAARVRNGMFDVNIVVPMGVAHRRRLVEQSGAFNPLLWIHEDWDLWKRFARTRADFLFLPHKSGRYHVRPTSQSRRPKLSRLQRETCEANLEARRPLFGAPLGRSTRHVRKIAFASPHCLVDFTSGAAIATARALQLLQQVGFSCQAFCGSRLDAPEEGLLQELLAEQGTPNETRITRIAGRDSRLIFTFQGDVPVTVFDGASTRGGWIDPNEPQSFLTAYDLFLKKNRPDVVVTYGGDPVSQALIKLTKRHDIPVVFWLHNFGYPHARAFSMVDYVVVPSEFSRQHHWNKLGLACHVLPNVIDLERIRVDDPEPKYVTFVNPHPTKGVYVFARIADQLACRRPDIPLLVVEGRSQARMLAQTGLDLSWAKSLHTMPNTPDPRQFYRQSRLILMPSLGNESFGLVAAEAMTNGIPVLASDRGALPEVVGEEGLLFKIPARHQPKTRAVPTAEEVKPWVETVIRLWDDVKLYEQSSRQAQDRACLWHPERLGQLYTDFFGSIFPQPGPPVLPKATQHR